MYEPKPYVKDHQPIESRDKNPQIKNYQQKTSRKKPDPYQNL